MSYHLTEVMSTRPIKIIGLVENISSLCMIFSATGKIVRLRESEATLK